MNQTDWVKKLIDTVAETGEEGSLAVKYLRARRVKVGFGKANPSVGAFWTLFGNIRLNSRHYSKKTMHSDAYLLSLLVHEVRHLQQGFFTALSVYGELDAWQTGFRVFRQVTGHYPAHKAAEEIMSMPLGWDRTVLRRASVLMREYAGKGYRSNWLPLYPLGKEIRFHLFGKKPGA